MDRYLVEFVEIVVEIVVEIAYVPNTISEFADLLTPQRPFQALSLTTEVIFCL